MVRNIKYKTSRDYTHLRELLDKGIEVVCFTTYNFFNHEKDKEPYMVTDICVARKNSLNGEYDFGARGIGYGDYDPGYHTFSFEDFCEKCLNLEYIEPNNV